MLALLLLTAAPDLAAVGVVVAPRPERSVAVLRAQGRTRVASVGEAVFGGRVAAVHESGVVLEFPGRRVELKLAGSAAATPALAAAPRPQPPPGEVPEAPPPRTLSRIELERRLAADMPRILAETGLAPVLEEGRVTGMRLTRVAENSLLTEAGLRPGDVLQQINGVPIDGMASLLALWPRLQSASELQAVVIRDGRPVTLAVTLR
jgi:general secretion pathway protein C